MASTPVNAVAPCEKAFRMAKTLTVATAVAASGSGSTGTPTAGHPPMQRTRPYAINTKIEKTKP
jgi:hypothetical protein